MVKMTRDEYNEKRRKDYAAKRAAGLSRNESRSVKKAVQKNPSLLDVLGGMVRGVMKGADDAAQSVADVLTGGAKQLTKETTKAPKKSSYKRKTVTSKKTGKRIPTFAEFTKQQKKKNPNVSANKLKQDYREKGGTVSNKKAYGTVREVTGVPRDRTKRTRMKYYGRSKNPLKKVYRKDAKYIYVVKYGLEIEGTDELETHYITLTSSEKLTEPEIVDSVGQELNDLVRSGAKNARRELYVVRGLNAESIHVEYAIDMSLD